MAEVERVRTPTNIVLEGPTRVGRCDGTTALVPPSLQPLVVLLCLTPERLNRETVLATLWPDVDAGRAKARLSTALWRLRRLLADCERPADRTPGTGPVPDIGGGDEPAAGVTSVARADDLLARPLTSASARDWLQLRDVDLGAVDWRRPTADDLRRRLERVALIDPAQFAAGCHHPWVEEQRTRLDLASQRCLAHLVEVNAGLGRDERALELAETLVARDEFREDGHRWLMTLHARAGRRAEAIRQYERCRTILADELGIEPLPETADLADAIRSAPSPTAPRSTAPAATPPAVPDRDARSAGSAGWGESGQVPPPVGIPTTGSLGAALDELGGPLDLGPDPEAVLAALARARAALAEVEAALRGRVADRRGEQLVGSTEA